jgi:hypothetical protein
MNTPSSEIPEKMLRRLPSWRQFGVSIQLFRCLLGKFDRRGGLRHRLALWNDNIYRGFTPYIGAHVNWAVGAISLVMLGQPLRSVEKELPAHRTAIAS